MSQLVMDHGASWCFGTSLAPIHEPALSQVLIVNSDPLWPHGDYGKIKLSVAL